MVKLNPIYPLNGFVQDLAHISIRECDPGEVISIACIRGQEKVFASAFKKAFSTSLPRANTFVKIDEGFTVWMGQGQYLLLQNTINVNADTELSAKLNGSAYTTLQTDGWALLELRGGGVLDILERFVPLDVRTASKNFAARTSAHHHAVIVIKHTDDRFQLLTPRTSAMSFLEILTKIADTI